MRTVMAIYNNDLYDYVFAVKLMKHSPPGNSSGKYCETSRKGAASLNN